MIDDDSKPWEFIIEWPAKIFANHIWYDSYDEHNVG